ncbi:MAG: undecaprenyldiphospho-muramoylpentapeptide beta-N-acetylglucosaminyltransferase [Geminicoccaceae bacterium]|nr:undecaprenyldiphospho-muramoylpentapeptide beta-N-acetylglucosaminyltransferase [Geminicoccaceae bacterium]
MRPPLALAAGGTGGHLFPALALAAELEARGRKVLLLTDARGARFLKGRPHRLVTAGSPSGGPAAGAGGLARLALGALQSLRVLRRERPGALAAFGGYASVPPAVAAAPLRIPCLLHEQNAVLGRANRLVAKRARLVALAFAGTKGLPAGVAAKAVVVGNPVRPGFAAVPRPPADGRFHLLVLGGSQGARALSDAVPEAVAGLSADLRARLRVAQQCRPEDLGRVGAAYDAAGVAAELSAFFDDVPARMAAADLVVARAGASTIAELLALAKPAFLVPYPHAADDHQRANAEALEAAGAARLFVQAGPEYGLDAGRLGEELATFMNGSAALKTMAEAAGALARPDAAARLADRLLQIEQEGFA